MEKGNMDASLSVYVCVCELRERERIVPVHEADLIFEERESRVRRWEEEEEEKKNPNRHGYGDLVLLFVLFVALSLSRLKKKKGERRQIWEGEVFCNKCVAAADVYCQSWTVNETLSISAGFELLSLFPGWLRWF